MSKAGGKFVLLSLFVSALLLTGLSGCASYQAKPLSATKNVALFSKRTVDNAALRAFIQTQRAHPVALWPLKTWTLDDLTLVALYYHPELALARARWHSARAKVITAGTYPNPNLNFLPQYATNSNAALSPWTIGLSVSIPVLTAGKRSYRITEAHELAKAARLDVMQTTWRIRAKVRQPWLRLYAVQRRIILLNNQLNDARALLTILRQQFAAGQIPQSKVVAAQLQRTNIHLSLVDAQAVESQARTALAGALSVPVAALRGIHFNFDSIRKLPSPDKMPVTRFRTYALTQRADIRAALVRYAASVQALKLALANQYPNLQIGPGYQWDQGVRRWSIGFSLSLPVFNQNQGPIAEARAQREEQAAQFRVLQAYLITRFNHVLLAYRVSNHSLMLARHLLGTGRTELALARSSWRAGEINRVDLLRIRLKTQTYHLGVLSRRVQAEQALAALEDTLEHPLHQPKEMIHAIDKLALSLSPLSRSRPHPSAHHLSTEAASL